MRGWLVSLDFSLFYHAGIIDGRPTLHRFGSGRCGMLPLAVSRVRVSLSRRRDGDQAPSSAQVVGHCGEPDLQAGFGQAKPAHPA